MEFYWIHKEMKVSSGEGTTKAGKFRLTFYGTTKEFPLGAKQDVVLRYIKQAKEQKSSQKPTMQK